MEETMVCFQQFIYQSLEKIVLWYCISYQSSPSEVFVEEEVKFENLWCCTRADPGVVWVVQSNPPNLSLRMLDIMFPKTYFSKFQTPQMEDNSLKPP